VELLVTVKRAAGGGHLVRRPVLFEVVRSRPGQTNLAAAAARNGVAASRLNFQTAKF